MFVFMRIIIKDRIIISGIDICFLAHLKSMVEAYILPDYEQCYLLRLKNWFYWQFYCAYNNCPKTIYTSTSKFSKIWNYFKLFDNYFPSNCIRLRKMLPGPFRPTFPKIKPTSKAFQTKYAQINLQLYELHRKHNNQPQQSRNRQV